MLRPSMLVIVAVACSAAACGEADHTASCLLITKCQEFVGTNLSEAQTSCQTLSGTWLEIPCSRTYAVGGCQETVGTAHPSTRTTWYYTGTVDDVRAQCPNGTFVAPDAE